MSKRVFSHKLSVLVHNLVVKTNLPVHLVGPLRVPQSTAAFLASTSRRPQRHARPRCDSTQHAISSHHPRRSVAFQRTDSQPEIPVEVVRRTHAGRPDDPGTTERTHLTRTPTSPRTSIGTRTSLEQRFNTASAFPLSQWTRRPLCGQVLDRFGDAAARLCAGYRHLPPQRGGQRFPRSSTRNGLHPSKTKQASSNPAETPTSSHKASSGDVMNAWFFLRQIFLALNFNFFFFF